jgi:hypothetical protein
VAGFRLVQIENIPSVFICQHLTRELVWRPHWQKHVNGASELLGISVPMKHCARSRSTSTKAPTW